jgi:hypothetical protein
MPRQSGKEKQQNEAAVSAIFRLIPDYCHKKTAVSRNDRQDVLNQQLKRQTVTTFRFSYRL